MPAIWPRVLGERPLDGAEVVERDDDDQVHDRLRDAGVAGHAQRRVGRADLVGLGQHRDLHRVVVAVVAALDLDHQVAPGQRAHQVDGVHGRLGAGVGEPPQRQAEAADQLLGDARWRPRWAGRSGCRGRPGRTPPRRSRGGRGRRWTRRTRRACRRTRCRRRPRRGSPGRGSSRRPAAGRSASWRWRRRPATWPASAIMAVLRGCRRTNASDSAAMRASTLGGAGVDGRGGGHDGPFGRGDRSND